MSRRVGVYTGGGSAPGLNAAIWALVNEARRLNIEIIGFFDGARGIVKEKMAMLSPEKVRDWHIQGGANLRTSRTNPEKNIDEYVKRLQGMQIDGLITIGGNDTARAALVFCEAGIPTNHVGKTIDNDLKGTEKSFGYETAVFLGAQDANRLATDARSSGRVYISEVMGRDAGFLTFGIFSASKANFALIPEEKFQIHELANLIRDKWETELHFALLILVAEGAQDPDLAKRVNQEKQRITSILSQKMIPGEVIEKYFPEPKIDSFGNYRLNGAAEMVKNTLEELLSPEIKIVRTPDLGYQYRCADPIPFDIDLAAQMARHVIFELHQGKSGIMAALQGDKIVSVALTEVAGKTRTLAAEKYQHYLLNGGILHHA